MIEGCKKRVQERTGVLSLRRPSWMNSKEDKVKGRGIEIKKRKKKKKKRNKKKVERSKKRM